MDSIREILDDLAVRGNFEWSDKSKRRGLVLWRSVQEVGQDIYKWVRDSGQTGWHYLGRARTQSTGSVTVAKCRTRFSLQGSPR